MRSSTYALTVAIVFWGAWLLDGKTDDKQYIAVIIMLAAFAVCRAVEKAQPQ